MLVHPAARELDERAIEAAIIGGPRHEEAARIAIADHAKAPVVAGKVRMTRGVRHEPRIAPPLDARRVRAYAPDLHHAVGIRVVERVDLGYEAAVRRVAPLPEHRAHVVATQRIRDAVAAPAVDREPAFVGLARADPHRPALGAHVRTVDRHAIDVPRFGAKARERKRFTIGHGVNRFYDTR